MPKTNYKDTSLPIENWNSTTFKTYLEELNIKHYGIPCIHGYPPQENKQITSMCEQYSKEIIKEMIEIGVREHNSTPKYPVINWTFLFTYRKQFILPRILKKTTKKEVVQELNVDEIKKLF